MSRTRTMSTSTDPIAATLTRGYCLDQTFVYPSVKPLEYVDFDVSIVTNSLDKTMTDEEIPEFKKLSREGQIFVNPMESETVSEIDPVIEVIHSHTTYLGVLGQPGNSQEWTKYLQMTHSGHTDMTKILKGIPPSHSGLLDADDLIPTRVSDIAIASAYSNISHSEILVLAALAESSKTVSSLISLMRSVSNIFKKISLSHPAIKKLKSGKKKNLKVKDLRRIMKEVEDLYMNARYNLRPLYYDICGVMSLLDAKPKHDRYTFRGNADETAKSEDFCVYVNTDIKNYTASPALLNFKLQRKCEQLVSARAGVLTRLDDLTIWRRMGIDAIPETLWELTPFSFIVDWFANVGNTILAWTPKFGSTELASWVTVKQQKIQSLDVVVNECTSDVIPSWSMYGGYTTISCELKGASYKKITNTTERVPSPPRPILPHLDVNLDSLKLLDLAIIVKNLLSNQRNLYLRAA